MRIILLLLLILPFSVYTQEFHEQVAFETCECIENLDLTDLSYQQKEVQLGICLIVGIGKFGKELEHTYGKLFFDFDENEQNILYERIGFKMMEVCPFTMMSLSEHESLTEKDSEFKVEIGKISSINAKQFNTVVLKLGDGSLNNFLWLWDFQGSEILIENKYSDKWINIFYLEVPMYNPETTTYINYKVIEKIELGE